MAAALAASLPAPQAAPTPAAPTYEAIPASMSKAIDIEAEIPLTCVQLDGIVRNFVDPLSLMSPSFTYGRFYYFYFLKLRVELLFMLY